MDKIKFETRAISIFRDYKYVFHDELQQSEVLKKMSVSERAALITLGSLGGLAVNFSYSADSEARLELTKLGLLCDLIGINASYGSVNIVLFVHSDDLTDEAIIGKCRLIRDKLTSFKKFTMRIGWTKLPITAFVFFVFSNSDKAFHFRTSVQEHCKIRDGFLQKISVLPSGIDLAAKSVCAHKGWPPLYFKSAVLEAKLFS